MASDSDNENYEEEELEDELEDEEEEIRPSKGGKKQKKRRRGSQFIDDVAEEDEDEDEDDEEDRGRKKYKNASIFFEEDAAVADSDEEEEEGGEDDDFVEEGEELGGPEEAGTARMHHRMMQGEDDDQNDELMEDYIRKRYGRQREREDVDDEEDQQALLPSVKDPKLWLVRCQLGHEREAVVSLMQKFVNEEGTEKALLIKSAVALDHLKGYVYVESEKEAYVKRACYGLRNLYSYNVKLVPIKEMTDVLSVEKKVVDVDRGTWVRVKIGIYKGDLGQVVEVDHVRQTVTVKLIPRVDLQAVKAALDAPEEVKRGRKPRARPPARFVNITEVESLRIPVEHKRDPVTGGMFDFFDGKKFMNNYHYKTMSLKSIDGNSITPTFDELQKFQKPPGEDGEAADDLLTIPPSLASKQRGQFMKGDVVQVVEGDLRGIIGVVEKVDDDTVTVRPRHGDLKESLLFKEKELRKFYKVGDHVKVIAGQQEGTTGMIIKVDEGVVDIISDVTKEDIKIFARDIVPSSEVTSGLTKLGDYELHDLVQLDTSVGMIIKVEKDGCQVLRGNADRPDVATYKLRDIRHKLITRRYTAQDQQGNTIGVNDVVRVLKGKFEKTQGTIEHVNQGMLFLHDKHRQENQGYLCVRASDCRILGGNRPEQGGLYRPNQPLNNNSRFAPKSPAHFLQSPGRGGGPPFGGRGGFGRGGRGGGGGRGLIGKVIKIRKGPWKGYQGRIVDVVDAMVRLELESQMKVISVPRADLPDGMGEPPMSSQRESTRYTPRMGTPTSRTPMHAYMSTPMRDGAMTPLHDGMRTPMRDRAWNPAMTPMRESNWDDANPSTWNAGAHYEPGYTPYSPAAEANTGTPGLGAFDAATPAWASTPGTGYGGRPSVPEPATAPTPVLFSGNAPSPYGLPNTPGGQPTTPGGTQAAYPGTPGGQPMTPGAAIDPTSPATGGGGMNDFWGLPDVVVKVTKANEAENLGVIKEVLQDGTCTVALGAEGEGELVTASHGELELVLPVKGNKIKIMTGDYRGEVGKLVGVDGTDGIVKMASLDIKILDMSSLGKALVAGA